MLVENFPFDKYELEPSPLTQYILERRNPNVCWQVMSGTVATNVCWQVMSGTVATNVCWQAMSSTAVHCWFYVCTAIIMCL